MEKGEVPFNGEEIVGILLAIGIFCQLKNIKIQLLWEGFYGRIF